MVYGHCIGVDPYYLAYKAKNEGYVPEMILAGRKVNDSVGKFVANQVIEEMKNKNLILEKSRVLILGFSFKENCQIIGILELLILLVRLLITN